MAGNCVAYVAAKLLAMATRNPPKEEKACVNPSTFSRCNASGNSSASQATAATNSTQTPMKTRQRQRSNCGSV